MVKIYTASQKAEKLTKNFTVGDFWGYKNHKEIKLDTKLAEIWEKIYAQFGERPLLRNAYGAESKDYYPHPSSCYRDSANWQGSRTSQHRYGRATDVYVPGVAAYRLAQYVEALPEVGGIGLYLAKSGELNKAKHIHIDTRTHRALWGWNGWTSGTNTPGYGGVPTVFTIGHRSAAIEELQRELNGIGYSAGVPDGVYGKLTEAAVIAFQRDNGLKADGKYGRATNEKLGLFDWA